MLHPLTICIDRGGTFTDAIAFAKNVPPIVMKLLSVDSAYPDAPTEAIRRIGTPFKT
jgi:5-oxoprolinase (ATP-hydrolysing)